MLHEAAGDLVDDELWWLDDQLLALDPDVEELFADIDQILRTSTFARRGWRPWWSPRRAGIRYRWAGSYRQQWWPPPWTATQRGPPGR